MTEDPLPDPMGESTAPKEADAAPADSGIQQESPPSEDETITFKRTHFFSVLVVLAFVIGLGLGFVIWGRASEPTTTAAAETSEESQAAVNEPAAPPPTSGSSASVDVQAEPTSIPRFDIPVEGDPRLGPEDAEIVIVEFSDYECPFCQKFHNETFKQLIEAYPDQIQFVYRDFPLTNIHPNAFPAAEAANCANEQGVFWEYHDLLFGGFYGLSEEAYTQYASQLDIDLDEFEACMNEGRYRDEVQADYDFAAQLGIRSTPTFFINGLPLIGAQPFEVFSQVIDKELAGELN